MFCLDRFHCIWFFVKVKGQPTGLAYILIVHNVDLYILYPYTHFDPFCVGLLR